MTSAPDLWLLDLCSGVGMLGLAIELLFEEMTGAQVRPIAYCEMADYPRDVLNARMADGTLHRAPILRDATRLLVPDLLGRVDLICAGIPCQPHSHANVRERGGVDDDRWLWDDIRPDLGDLRPGLIFVENVSGMLDSGALDVITGLASLGYDAEWACMDAGAAGQSHGRPRLWVLGADANRERRQRVYREGQPEGHLCGVGGNPMHPWVAENGLPQPCACRVDHGLARRVERTRAVGNGVDVLQAMVAYALLGRRLGLWD